MAPPVAQTAAVAEAAGAGGAQPQQRQAGGIGSTISGIFRIAVFWYFASKFFSPKQKPIDPSQSQVQLMNNLFHKGESLDMWLYLTEHEKFNDFGNDRALFWQETNITYAVWTPESIRTKSLKYYPSENNGSLYAHVFFTRSGFPIDPSDPKYQPLNSFGRTHAVATYFPKRKVDKKKSLLGNPKDSAKSHTEVEVCLLELEVSFEERLHMIAQIIKGMYYRATDILNAKIDQVTTGLLNVQ